VLFKSMNGGLVMPVSHNNETCEWNLMLIIKLFHFNIIS